MNFLTVKEVADKLKITPQAIYSLINKGFLSAYRIGAPIQIDSSDLETYLQGRKLKATKKL